MHYPAKDLFREWYSQSVKIALDSPEINLRQASIDRLIANSSSTFWLDSVRLFYGILEEMQPTYQQYVKECREDDSSFPLRNNQNLLRTIAGCVVAQKIESGRSALNDVLCLSLLTTNFLNRFGSYPLVELPPRALTEWLRECRMMRSINKELTYKSSSTEVKSKKIDIPEITDTSYGADANSVRGAMKRVQEHLTSLQADIKTVSNHFANNDKAFDSTLSQINTRFDVLSEESNILWWLFSGYSRDFDQQFNEIGLPAMSIIGPKELADLTLILPGLGHVKAHLSKSFSLAAEGKTADQSIKAIVDSGRKVGVQVEDFIPKIPENYQDLLPCLFGLHCSEEFGESWADVYKKKSKIDSDHKVSLLDFAEQLYRECLFVRVFDELD